MSSLLASNFSLLEELFLVQKELIREILFLLPDAKSVGAALLSFPGFSKSLLKQEIHSDSFELFHKFCTEVKKVTKKGMEVYDCTYVMDPKGRKDSRTLRDKDGYICKQIFYEKGNKKSEALFYPYNGPCHVEFLYEEGKKRLGTWYRKDGSVRRKTDHKDGKICRDKVWFRDGELRSSIEFENAEMHGEFLERCRVCVFRDIPTLMAATYSRGRLCGPFRVWNSDTGVLTLECSFGPNGKFDGEYISYYENGSINQRFFYENGKRQGLGIKWRENGKVMAEVVYVDGEMKEVLYKDGNKKDVGRWLSRHKSARCCCCSETSARRG